MKTNIFRSQKQNLLQTYFYMFILTIFLGAIGWSASSVFKLPAITPYLFILISFLINFVAYFFSDRLVITQSGAKPITKENAVAYIQLVESLCQKAEIPLPKLYYLPEIAINAFATGRDIKHSSLVVTQGAIERLTPEELAGVIAHEITHIKSLDVRLMTLVTLIAGAITLLSDLVFRSNVLGKVQEKDRSGIISLITTIMLLFAPLTVLLIQLAISRKREYSADLGSCLITKHPVGLSNALQKISRDMIPLGNVSYATAHLYISDPFQNTSFIEKILGTHPPIQKRINKLKNIIL